MRKEVELLIKDIANNTEIKKEFIEEVVIFDRTIKERLEDICKIFNANDTNLITYQMLNKNRTLNMNNDIEIKLDMNVWSKESQYKTELIADKIVEIIENSCVFNIEEIVEENIEDDIYYRTRLMFVLIKYN